MSIRKRCYSKCDFQKDMKELWNWSRELLIPSGGAMLFDRWDSLLLKKILTVQYVQCCNRGEYRCCRSTEDARAGMSPSSQRVGKTSELDLEGKVKIELVEKMGRAYSRYREKHKGRQQDMKELDRVGSSDSWVWPEVGASTKRQSWKGSWGNWTLSYRIWPMEASLDGYFMEGFWTKRWCQICVLKQLALEAL